MENFILLISAIVVYLLVYFFAFRRLSKFKERRFIFFKLIGSALLTGFFCYQYIRKSDIFLLLLCLLFAINILISLFSLRKNLSA